MTPEAQFRPRAGLDGSARPHPPSRRSASHGETPGPGQQTTSDKAAPLSFQMQKCYPPEQEPLTLPPPHTLPLPPGFPSQPSHPVSWFRKGTPGHHPGFLFGPHPTSSVLKCISHLSLSSPLPLAAPKPLSSFFLFFKKKNMFIDFRETETLICCLPYMLQLWIEPTNLGMCPDWESNPQDFGVRDDVRPPEPHQQGQASGSFHLDNQGQAFIVGSRVHRWVPLHPFLPTSRQSDHLNANLILSLSSNSSGVSHCF